MSEKMPSGPTPEQLKLQEEEARAAEWMKEHPETAPAPEARRESGPEVAEFEAMIASFEAAHSLEALHAIEELTPEEAAQHPVRQPAKIALEPIVAKLGTLKEETNISAEKHAELKAAYKRLSQAVGMINRGKVDHTR